MKNKEDKDKEKEKITYYAFSGELYAKQNKKFPFDTKQFMLAFKGQRETWLSNLRKKIALLEKQETNARHSKELYERYLLHLESLLDLEKVQEDHIDDKVRLKARIKELEAELDKLK